MNLSLLALVIALQLADAWTTVTIINRGGYEKNKALVWLAARLPGRWTWLIAAKLGACAMAVFIALQSHIVATLSLVAIVAFYGWVVWSNVRVMKKLN